MKNMFEDEKGFAYLAFGFFLLVLYVICTHALNALQEPTEMEIIILDQKIELVSADGVTKTYNIWAEIKNIGAKGTAVIGLQCYDVDQNIVYDDVEILDLDKNQRTTTSHIVEMPKNENFEAQFYISETIEDKQSIEPLSPELPITRP